MSFQAEQQQSRQAGPQNAPPHEDISLLDQFRRVMQSGETPLAPLATACQADKRSTDHAYIHRRLKDMLGAFRARGEHDPYTNPIQLLAHEITRMIEGDELHCSSLEQLIQRITVLGFVRRAERLDAYLGETDADANRAKLRQLVGQLANIAGRPASFETFRQRVESDSFGVVMTAHPTFGVSAHLTRILAELATDTGLDGERLNQSERDRLIRQAIAAEHRPDPKLDLQHEHALSLQALANAQNGMREVYHAVLEVAEELYPEQWTELKPRLVTLATWVGYDLDGRSDISWTDTFTTRLKVQALQLQYYRDRIADLQGACSDDYCYVELVEILNQLADRFDVAIAEVKAEIEVFHEADSHKAADRERIRLMAKEMHEGQSRRLIESEPVIALVNRAIALSPDRQRTLTLCVLRAEIANYGLGMAHTHMRLNAKQLHNSVRKLIGIEVPPSDPARRHSYLAALDALHESVRRETINFASVLQERASAKRLFMVIAQMIKYVDATTPVRFLIAECESGATLLTALYFARLFGVEDKVDISPLFETAYAMDHGTGLIEEAIKNEHYRAYLRRRGRLCVQTGFSDSGRYLGQTAAGFVIEQFRLKLADLLRRYDMTDVQLVVFDTHGESIGRGAHPASLTERLRYVASPRSRAAFRKILDFKDEVSFQGGDGYVFFTTPTIALATLSRVVEFTLDEDGETNDPFYLDRDYVAEFMAHVRLFNETMMDDPNYAALLGAYGVNMLYPSGSRAVRREGGGGRTDLAHPSQMRAIPQNAILQQLGFLANTIGGVGESIARDPDHFRHLYGISPRFRRTIAMAEYALNFSDFNVLRAYVDTLDPMLWLLTAANTQDREDAEIFRRVSEYLEEIKLHDKLIGVLRVFQRDFVDLTQNLAAWTTPIPEGERPVAIDSDTVDDLHILHALKVALIQQIFLLAARIPEFSDQYGTTPDQIIGRLLQLDVESTLPLLERIFPKIEPVQGSDDFGEPSSYQSDMRLSYEQEHDLIFQPMARLYDLLRRVGTGISHHIGAIG